MILSEKEVETLYNFVQKHKRKRKPISVEITQHTGSGIGIALRAQIIVHTKDGFHLKQTKDITDYGAW